MIAEFVTVITVLSVKIGFENLARIIGLAYDGNMHEARLLGVVPRGTLSSAERRSVASMAMRLWDIDWSTTLPAQLDGSSLELGTDADALAFIDAHYGEIWGDAGALFYSERLTPAKRRFLEEMDVFLFRAEGRTVGLAMGHPTDWATYYVRTIAVLPEFRSRSFAVEFERRLCAPLAAAGVDRVEAETSPANMPLLRVLLGQGYLVTSTVNSERWGAMLRLTKFLNPSVEQTFRRHFISVPNFERNNK